MSDAERRPCPVWIGVIGGAIFTVLGPVMSVVGIMTIIAAINQKR